MIRHLTAAFILLFVCEQLGRADLVAHWPLNEGSGEIFRDLAGGNDGFLPDDAEIEWEMDGPPGIQDVSVNFIGDTGPSYIETPFVGIGGNDPRTIALWVKADPQPMSTAMVSWGSLENGRKWHFRIDQTQNNALRTEYMGGQNYATTDLADGEWHFVASVFPEGAEFGSEIIHYLDGEEDDFAGGTDLEIDTSIDPDEGAFPVHIGFAAGHAGRWFVGQMADVRIYDEALDQAALQEIMMGGGNRIPGDFDGDGQLTAADIDRLSLAVRELSTDGQFDLNGDTRVDQEDRRIWVEELKNTYFGDANLDLEFNSSDFVVVFQASQYEDNTPGNSTWATGDWNGDGDFTSSDFVTAFQGSGFEVGPRQAAAIPEPTSLAMCWFGTVVLILLRRRRWPNGIYFSPVEV